MTARRPGGPSDTTRVAVGGFTVVLVLAAVGTVGHRPLLIAPFAASAVLILALPHSPLSRPRTVVAGYLICTALGLALAAGGLPGAWSQGIAVGLGGLGMQLTRTLHPPAAAVPVLVGTTHADPGFLLTPVLLGAVVLAGLAALTRRLVHSPPAVPRVAAPTPAPCAPRPT
jgi:CBS-domain-containing membrane protein